jgi:hypothetical protein
MADLPRRLSSRESWNPLPTGWTPEAEAEWNMILDQLQQVRFRRGAGRCRHLPPPPFANPRHSNTLTQKQQQSLAPHPARDAQIAQIVERVQQAAEPLARVVWPSREPAPWTPASAAAPHLTIRLGGSFASGLATTDSDVDLCLTGSVWYQGPPAHELEAVGPRQRERALKRGAGKPAKAAANGSGNGNTAANNDHGPPVLTPVQCLPRPVVEDMLKALSNKLRALADGGQLERRLFARVPIVVFLDRASRLEVNVAFGGDSAFKSAFLGAAVAATGAGNGASGGGAPAPVAAPSLMAQLYRLVKAWAAAHGLNDPTAGTLNSWSLSLLLLCFLQRRGFAPPLWWLAAPADEARGTGEAALGVPADMAEAVREGPRLLAPLDPPPAGAPASAYLLAAAQRERDLDAALECARARSAQWREQAARRSGPGAIGAAVRARKRSLAPLFFGFLRMCGVLWSEWSGVGCWAPGEPVSVSAVQVKQEEEKKRPASTMLPPLPRVWPPPHLVDGPINAAQATRKARDCRVSAWHGEVVYAPWDEEEGKGKGQGKGKGGGSGNGGGSGSNKNKKRDCWFSIEDPFDSSDNTARTVGAVPKAVAAARGAAALKAAAAAPVAAGGSSSDNEDTSVDEDEDAAAPASAPADKEKNKKKKMDKTLSSPVTGDERSAAARAAYLAMASAQADAVVSSPLASVRPQAAGLWLFFSRGGARAPPPGVRAALLPPPERRDADAPAALERLFKAREALLEAADAVTRAQQQPPPPNRAAAKNNDDKARRLQLLNACAAALEDAAGQALKALGAPERPRVPLPPPSMAAFVASVLPGGRAAARASKQAPTLDPAKARAKLERARAALQRAAAVPVVCGLAIEAAYESVQQAVVKAALAFDVEGVRPAQRQGGTQPNHNRKIAELAVDVARGAGSVAFGLKDLWAGLAEMASRTAETFAAGTGADAVAKSHAAAELSGRVIDALVADPKVAGAMSAVAQEAREATLAAFAQAEEAGRPLPGGSLAETAETLAAELLASGRIAAAAFAMKKSDDIAHDARLAEKEALAALAAAGSKDGAGGGGKDGAKSRVAGGPVAAARAAIEALRSACEAAELEAAAKAQRAPADAQAAAAAAAILAPLVPGGNAAPAAPLPPPRGSAMPSVAAAAAAAAAGASSSAAAAAPASHRSRPMSREVLEAAAQLFGRPLTGKAFLVACRDWSAAGSCAKGAKCLFRHDTAAAATPMDEAQQREQQQRRERLRELGWRPSGQQEEQEEEDEEARQARRRREIDQSRWRREGGQEAAPPPPCTATTTTTARAPASRQQQGQQASAASAAATNAADADRRPRLLPSFAFFVPCRNWSAGGACATGAKCLFGHDEPAATSPEGKTVKAEQQQHWEQLRREGWEPRSRRGAAEEEQQHKGQKQQQERGRGAGAPVADARTLEPQKKKQQDEGKPPAATAAASNNAGPRPPRLLPSNAFTGPCRNWSVSGTCAMGAKCVFRHDSPAAATPEGEAQKREQQRRWEQLRRDGYEPAPPRRGRQAAPAAPAEEQQPEQQQRGRAAAAAASRPPSRTFVAARPRSEQPQQPQPKPAPPPAGAARLLGGRPLPKTGFPAPCIHWSAGGACATGAKCLFRHDEPAATLKGEGQKRAQEKWWAKLREAEGAAAAGKEQDEGAAGGNGGVRSPHSRDEPQE